MNILIQPMTVEEALEKFPEGTITAVIHMDLDDFMMGLEQVLDFMESRIISGAFLGNISYTAVGVTEDNSLLVEIVGDIMD